MISLQTISKVNINSYWEVIRKLDPEFYLMRMDIHDYGINPYILRRVVRSLYNLTTKAHGTGYGKVQIFVENDKVSQIKPEESDTLDLDIFDK